MSGTVKSEGEDAKANTITIRVKEVAQNGEEETFFKVKRTTKMGRVLEAYAQRKGKDKKNLRFLIDGERIKEDDTPDSLELEENDQIDCLLEQHGGC